MTVTTVPFDTAAKVRKVLKAAKLEAKIEMPEPPVLEQLLNILVAGGHLSPQQAHQLFLFLTTGGFPVLPPVPFPDQETGKIPLYHLLRLVTITRSEGAEESFLDVLGDIAHAIVTTVETVMTVGDALAAGWHWLEETLHI
ncbi:hypothetical protein [Micromonospora chersina]|uniref:hypothetical protein n=1 Tax=Micromonospora chersina TaxID=47854 RepID=UPI003713CA13